MKPLRDFRIAYVGLKEGVHTFEYQVDSDFFSHFEDSLIKQCEVHVKLEFEKKSSFFILNFYIDGKVNVECDRCLEPFQKEIFGDFSCFVKFTEDKSGETTDDEVLYINRDDDFIDVSQLIYEYVHICLPMQLTHPKNEKGDDGCNPEILKYLATEQRDEPDPRWAELSKLKFDKN